jgi:hypothetical protein
VSTLYLPFLLQGLAMFVDEFYFHEKRGIKLWEKVGHPLDTLTVLLCYIYLIWGGNDVTIYVALSAFSCLFITKDEFVHANVSPASEHWLHALLFILHPICFLAAYFLKIQGQIEFLKIQTLVVFIFMLYQALRWSYPWRIKTK